jgi:16S rRNA processing protein RimM
MASNMPDQRVVVAKVRRPWGIDGSLAVTPYSDEPVALKPGARIFAGSMSYTIESVRRAGSGLALKLAGVDAPDEAAKLRDTELEALASDLPPPPPGVYYHYQIIGSQVVTLSGGKLGTVVDIIETPANDVYVVQAAEDESETLVPATQDIIKQIDTAAGIVRVDLPAG